MWEGWIWPSGMRANLVHDGGVQGRGYRDGLTCISISGPHGETRWPLLSCLGGRGMVVDWSIIDVTFNFIGMCGGKKPYIFNVWALKAKCLQNIIF